jgi:hypothetical protein
MSSLSSHAIRIDSTNILPLVAPLVMPDEITQTVAETGTPIYIRLTRTWPLRDAEVKFILAP